MQHPFRIKSEEIRGFLNSSFDIKEEEPFFHFDDEEYIPNVNGSISEESDAELESVIEYAEEYDSDEDGDEESTDGKPLTSKDGTVWQDFPFPPRKTTPRNISRECPCVPKFSKLVTAKEIFKSIITIEMCDIILRETNRKGREITDIYNESLLLKYPDADGKRPQPKVFKPITEEELNAFMGILLEIGAHKLNREYITELWKSNALPLFRAAMSRDRFVLLLRILRFDDYRTREVRLQTDKAAPIRDIWTILNRNLERGYNPSEDVTVVEQIFAYRGHKRFTQYMPSKPAKYGIKAFWACDSTSCYPLQGQLYLGRISEGDCDVNVGERAVLDLMSPYKGSGRNVTTCNVFTSLQLARVLNSWNLTLVGTVRKNKRFLPITMKSSRNREIYSTSFAFRKEAALCSYVPKRNKSIVLLSTMHMNPQISDGVEAIPEMLLHYNKKQGGRNVLDKMLMEYTTKRGTRSWPLEFFSNMIDVAALATYVIYMHHNPIPTNQNYRRIFLKSLASQLCMPSMQAHASIPRVIGNYFTKTAIEACLGHQIQQLAPSGIQDPRRRDAAGHALIVGSCFICRGLKRKQRKTRKSCESCLKPVCNEHSITKPKCHNCIESSLV